MDKELNQNSKLVKENKKIIPNSRKIISHWLVNYSDDIKEKAIIKYFGGKNFKNICKLFNMSCRKFNDYEALPKKKRIKINPEIENNLKRK
jgi:hypothetical protein